MIKQLSDGTWQICLLVGMARQWITLPEIFPSRDAAEKRASLDAWLQERFGSMP